MDIPHSGPFAGETYGHNVSQWIKDHPGHVLRMGFEGFGYAAWRKVGGRPSGEPVEGLTLDELHAKVSGNGERAASEETARP